MLSKYWLAVAAEKDLKMKEKENSALPPLPNVAVNPSFCPCLHSVKQTFIKYLLSMLSY